VDKKVHKVQTTRMENGLKIWTTKVPSPDGVFSPVRNVCMKVLNFVKKQNPMNITNVPNAGATNVRRR
jgi:hypothetical protein